jgi:hypothetical protein
MKKVITMLIVAFFVGSNFGATAQNLISLWSGNGDVDATTSKPNNYGWKAFNGSTELTTCWGAANGSNCRYTDTNVASVSAMTYNVGGATFAGRWLFIRWDNVASTNTSTVFSYPVQLEKCVSYKFTGSLGWYNNGSNPTFTVGINSAADNTGTTIATNSVNTATKLKLYGDTLTFSVPTSGTYYLTFKNNVGALGVVTDLSIVATTDASFNVPTNTLSFTGATNTKQFVVSGNALTDDITLSAPQGISLDVTKIAAADAQCGVTITATYDGISNIKDTIYVVNGTTTKKIPVTAAPTYKPAADRKYFIVGATSGKVIGVGNSGNVCLKYAEPNEATQLFTFAPADAPYTYYLINSNNKYLCRSKDVADSLVYVDEPNVDDPTYATWTAIGTSQAAMRIVNPNDLSKYMGSTTILDGSLLNGKQISTGTHTYFMIYEQDSIQGRYMFDANFEHGYPGTQSNYGGGPIGEWIPSPLKQLGIYGYSRLLNNSGWQSSGANCFYMRMVKDGNSYWVISQKIYGLTPGHDYQYSFDYKNSSATGQCYVYAAPTPNVGVNDISILGLPFQTAATGQTAATQSALNGVMTFTATDPTCYITFQQTDTTATGSQSFYIDNQVLTDLNAAAVNNVVNDQSLAYVSSGKIIVDMKLSAPSDVVISVFNTPGSVVSSLQTRCEAGNTEKVLGADLPSGVYLVRIVSNGVVTTKKVIK